MADFPLLSFPPGFVLFVGPDNDEGMTEAKAYCARNNLIWPQVAIKRTKDGEILVRVK